jgi:hypothetical protein
VHLTRGEPTDDLERLLDRARVVEDIQVVAPALVLAARGASIRRDRDRAIELVREFDGSTAERASMYRTALAPVAVRLLVGTGDQDLARDLVARSTAVTMRDALFADTAAALVRLADGTSEPASWTELVERWRTYGDPFEEAHAALALGQVASDETATARGRVLLDTLGVP